MEGPSDAFRRAIARRLLSELTGTHFALSGAGALIEHGVVHRVTVDVDIFTTVRERGSLPEIATQLRETLTQDGIKVVVERAHPDYARLTFENGEHSLEVDLGVDWREYPSVMSALGPIIDVRDSVGSKMSALYGRSEDRDYFDVAAAMLDGRWTAKELLALGRLHEPHLDLDLLGNVLHPERVPSPSAFAVYGFLDDAEKTMRTALEALRRACFESR